jgi:hypothetical protein
MPAKVAPSLRAERIPSTSDYGCLALLAQDDKG